MKPSPLILLSLVVALTSLGSTQPAIAQPTQVAYQGELKELGTRLNETVQMKFAIVTGWPDACKTLWSNDSTSVAGSEPANAVDAIVSNGLFTVYLGAPPMKPIGPDVFNASGGDSLRVWVRTTGAFEVLTD